MDGLVLDASVALAWCYPDENREYAYRVLDKLVDTRGIVPTHWRLEVANAILTGERKGRLAAGDILRFFALLESLSLVTDTQTSARSLTDIIGLARTHALTSYDAAYLELAMRENLMLATLDAALRKAAKSAGVRLFDRGHQE
jgi:predicted nucleic acid-binding protein